MSTMRPGTAVLSIPHTASSAAVIHIEVPKTAIAIATAAISTGMTTSVLCNLLSKNLLTKDVPISPVIPTISSIQVSIDTLTPVTFSRNGRRYVKRANWPMKENITATIPKANVRLRKSFNIPFALKSFSAGKRGSVRACQTESCNSYGNDGKEGPSPAHEAADETAKRSGDSRSKRVASVHDR